MDRKSIKNLELRIRNCRESLAWVTFGDSRFRVNDKSGEMKKRGEVTKKGGMTKKGNNKWRFW